MMNYYPTILTIGLSILIKSLVSVPMVLFPLISVTILSNVSNFVMNFSITLKCVDNVISSYRLVCIDDGFWYVKGSIVGDIVFYMSDSKSLFFYIDDLLMMDVSVILISC